METFRLKNIVIIILALLNAFLLVLIITNHVRTGRIEQETRQQIFALFEKNGIALDADTACRDTQVDTLSFLRNTDSEAAFAQAILGNVTFSDEGGGIYSYAGPNGVATFHTTGTFDISTTGISVGEPVDFAETICRDFGYGDITANLTDGDGSIHAIAYLEKMPVLNASITFTFSNSHLLSVTGTYISSAEAIPGGTVSLSALAALSDFLDFTVNNGVICSELTGMETGYLLQSTAGGTRLVPVWLLTADTFRCYTAGSGVTQLSA